MLGKLRKILFLKLRIYKYLGIKENLTLHTSPDELLLSLNNQLGICYTHQHNISVCDHSHLLNDIRLSTNNGL